MIRKYVPSGTRDLIYEEAYAQELMEKRVSSLFLRLGFKPVRTPVLEYLETFNHEKQVLPEPSIFAFKDGDGRLVSLRPDNTSPVVRVALSKLKDEELPLLLYYMQSVFRNETAFRAKKAEIMQGGVEIIGGNAAEEDLRCLFTALSTLKLCRDNYKLEIGHARFFDMLIEDCGLSDEEKTDLRQFVAAKNSAGYSFNLNMTNPRAVALARELPRLCGAPEKVLPTARLLAGGHSGALAILSELETIVQTLSEAGYGPSVIIDLGIVQTIDYYSGIVFKGYIENVGDAVLSGGRYDHLLASFGSNLGACGFGLNLSDVAENMDVQMPEPVRLRFDRGAQSLREAQARLDQEGGTKC